MAEKYFGKGGKIAAKRWGKLVPWLSELYAAYTIKERYALPRWRQVVYLAECGAVLSLCVAIPLFVWNADQRLVISRALTRLAERSGWFGRTVVAWWADVLANTGYNLCEHQRIELHTPLLLLLTLAQIELLRGNKKEAKRLALEAVGSATFVEDNDQRAVIYRDAALILTAVYDGRIDMRNQIRQLFDDAFDCQPFSWSTSGEKLAAASAEAERQIRTFQRTAEEK